MNVICLTMNCIEFLVVSFFFVIACASTFISFCWGNPSSKIFFVIKANYLLEQKYIFQNKCLTQHN